MLPPFPEMGGREAEIIHGQLFYTARPARQPPARPSNRWFNTGSEACTGHQSTNRGLRVFQVCSGQRQRARLRYENADIVWQYLLKCARAARAHGQQHLIHGRSNTCARAFMAVQHVVAAAVATSSQGVCARYVAARAAAGVMPPARAIYAAQQALPVVAFMVAWRRYARRHTKYALPYARAGARFAAWLFFTIAGAAYFHRRRVHYHTTI